MIKNNSFIDVWMKNENLIRMSIIYDLYKTNHIHKSLNSYKEVTYDPWIKETIYFLLLLISITCILW